MSTYGIAKLWACSLLVQQNTFFLYHRNSYANNPAMLRSPKPLIMRDVFLTKCSAPFPNPLSILYVPAAQDMFWNCAAALVLGLSLAPRVGARHLSAVWLLGGTTAGFAYIFHSQISPKRLNSKFDVNASSNGGWCAVCAFSLFVPGATLPVIAQPLALFTVPYVARCLYVEFVDLWRNPPPAHVAQITNWGCIGGITCGLVYGTLLLRRRTDAAMLKRFYSNIPNVK